MPSALEVRGGAGADQEAGSFCDSVCHRKSLSHFCTTLRPAQTEPSPLYVCILESSVTTVTGLLYPDQQGTGFKCQAFAAFEVRPGTLACGKRPEVLNASNEDCKAHLCVRFLFCFNFKIYLCVCVCACLSVCVTLVCTYPWRPQEGRGSLQLEL